MKQICTGISWDRHDYLSLVKGVQRTNYIDRFNRWDLIFFLRSCPWKFEQTFYPFIKFSIFHFSFFIFHFSFFIFHFSFFIFHFSFFIFHFSFFIFHFSFFIFHFILFNLFNARTRWKRSGDRFGVGDEREIGGKDLAIFDSKSDGSKVVGGQLSFDHGFGAGSNNGRAERGERRGSEELNTKLVGLSVFGAKEHTLG